MQCQFTTGHCTGSWARGGLKYDFLESFLELSHKVQEELLRLLVEVLGGLRTASGVEQSITSLFAGLAVSGNNTSLKSQRRSTYSNV